MVTFIVMKTMKELTKVSAERLRLSPVDKGTLRALSVVAGAGGLIALVWGGVGVASWFGASAPAVPLAADQPILGPDGELIGAFTGASVVIPNLSTGVRTLFAAGFGVAAFSVAATFLVVSGLFWLLARGGHFHGALTLAASLLGAVLAFGSVIEAGVLGFGSFIAAGQLGAHAPKEIFGSTTLNIGQLVAGLGLLALAYLLSRGEKLERDTVGLI